MRVLWFCGTPALGAAGVGAPAAIGGGWMAALEAALAEREAIDLGVAFPWDVPAVDRVRPAGGPARHEYFPFPRYPRGHRLRRLLVDASCRLEPESEVGHLERVVELARPDLVHVWGTEAFFGRVAERVDLPVLFEIQGLRTPNTEAYLRGFRKLDLLLHGSPKRLVNGRSLLHGYYRYRRSARRERRMLERARFVSGRTRWDRDVCAALAPGARYFHCDRVLRTAFYRGEWSRRAGDGELRLVSVLRGNAYKGVDVLVRCAELLGRLAVGRLDWTLVGVRPGEEIHRVVERKLGLSVERLGVRLVGRQPAEEVARRLLEADVYVHPSWIDNSPNGLSEAMRLGLPVVATGCGGVPSLVEDGREGLLVPTGDPWAMAGAIRRLAGDPELAAELGAAARSRAVERHDPARVAERVLAIYRDILAG